jgi:predicted enzyme related to lactoylglutathione lyase
MNISETPTYNSSVFFVSNVERSKQFYTQVVGQTIEMDFGRCVGFVGGFAIWDRSYAYTMMKLEKTAQQTEPQHTAEIYFEIHDLDALYKKIQHEHANFLHSIIEQPWGQRCFRIYDPDYHILEFAEPMSVVIKRYATQGLSTDEIIKKTLMPREIVHNILGVK